METQRHHMLEIAKVPSIKLILPLGGDEVSTFLPALAGMLQRQSQLDHIRQKTVDCGSNGRRKINLKDQFGGLPIKKSETGVQGCSGWVFHWTAREVTVLLGVNPLTSNHKERHEFTVLFLKAVVTTISAIGGAATNVLFFLNPF
ncbi:hypothetical protein C5167_014372 [Papaver somniferum]|uniref:Uncharacterized protein n=1 Tax=Papaver somniferum TaxID=3469 RepID=A0A4Y7J799_PAPSO|nr:hypothetical protein C5167_014372 [Papaver somniferum]